MLMASEDKVSLNRSFSSPDIPSSYLVSRRVVLEETYESPQSQFPLIRQYSYEEMYGRKPIHGSFSRFGTDFVNKTCIGNETPMDVDSNSDDEYKRVNSATYFTDNKLYERTSDDYVDNPRVTQKIPIKTNAKSVKAKPRSNLKRFVYALSMILAAIFAVYYNIVEEPPLVKNNAVIKRIVDELEKNVVHQDAALKVITKNLWHLDLKNNEHKRILAFVGSTGVGKSYSANIIKKHLREALVHEVNALDLNKVGESDRVMGSIRYDECNVIVIDNLRSDDSYNVGRFITGLPDTCLLVIPIFNIQETHSGFKHVINSDDIRNITDKLMEFYAGAVIAVFNTLTSDAMIPWLQRELIARHVAKTDHAAIIKSILSDHDVEYKGFKGIHAKLNLIDA